MRLLFIVISFLISSCATSKMNVEKGTFQAIKPPNIYGNSRYLEEGSSNIISYEANIGKNKTIPLPGVINEYTCIKYLGCLDETPANINYRLIENTLGFHFHRVTKENNNSYFGFGGGVQNFPYGLLTFGYNGKFIEIGGAGFWGLTVSNASYEGTWGYYKEGFIEIGASRYYYGHIKYKDIKILHSYGGLVAHTSFYWEKFALSYAASISNPWLVSELKASSEDYADISFFFPVLLMQDIGISYTPSKIKYRFGVNQITGIKFPGQYWGVSVQMAYMR